MLQKQPAKSENFIVTELKTQLKKHYANNLYRSRIKYLGKQTVNPKGYVNFSSNDYLGFATNPEIIKKTQDLISTIGLGSGASTLISGYHTIHQDLENTIKDLLKCEQVILFPSGYMANLAIADVLLKINPKNSIAIHDHNNHASILDGTRMANAQFARFQHNNIDHLSKILNKYESRNKFIFTESLFSMDGDFADLTKIHDILQQHTNTCLIVDESHSFGLYNSGKILSYGMHDLVMGTFGKAMGAAGAFVAGPKVFIESFIQFARPYIYTTSLSPVMAAAALYSIRLNQQTDEFREKLFTNIAYFCNQLNQIGIQPLNSTSPIQPIIIGDSKDCLQAVEYLHQNNIILTAIRSPTVALNKARLRITLSANHNKEQIDHLIKHLAVLAINNKASVSHE